MGKEYKQYAVSMKALADETRIEIFDMLTSGEFCACDILEKFNITQPTLSYHMKILCDSGLVNSRKEGVWMKYSINKERLNSLTNLFNDINTRVNQGDNK